MRKIKIAYITYNLKYGGVEKYIVDIVNGINPHRFEPIILCLKESGDLGKRIFNGVRIYELHKRDGNDLLLPLRMARILNHENVDIIHSNNWSTFCESVISKYLSTSKLIIHVQHGVEKNDSEATSSAKRYFRNRIRQILSYMTDQVVSVCDYTMNFVEHDWNISRKKSGLIYNGVDVNLIKKSSYKRICKIKEIGFLENDIIVGSVGRLMKIKDYPTLIDSFRIVSKHERAKLLLVGDGPEKGKINALIEKFGLTDKIRLVGNRADIPDLLNLMDVFVLASVSEGMSLAILEAMAAGLPVVATDVGGNPELVEHGVTGFLVPEKDPAMMAASLCKLIDAPHIREEMGAQGRLRIEKFFSLEKMLRSYESLYISLLKQKKAV